MNDQTTIETTTAIDASDTAPASEKLVEETLVEEVSIDGMCGVY